MEDVGQPQDAGVTGEDQSASQDSSPQSTGSSQGQEGQIRAQPKSKDHNFKQLRESVNKLEAERKQWQEKEKSLQGAAQIDQLLRNDPRGGLKQIAQALGIDIKTLIEAQSEIPQIDFGQYDQNTANLLKFLHERASKVEQLEKWKAEFEQKMEVSNQQQQQSYVQKNIETLENTFADDMVKDGFRDKNGNGNEEVIEVIKGAILAKIAEQGVDPRVATIEQYRLAHKQVTKGLSAYRGKTLQNAVTRNVPPSGSRNGTATTAKPTMTRDQRIALLADMAKQNPQWGFES